MRLITLLGLMVVVVFLLSACRENVSGKASQSRQSCIGSNAACGDSVCSPCESCATCQKDCCKNVCYETDGGQNYILKGKISGAFNGKDFAFEDYCMSERNLMEYYCGRKDFTLPTNLRIDCILRGGTCKNGACSK